MKPFILWIVKDSFLSLKALLLRSFQMTQKMFKRIRRVALLLPVGPLQAINSLMTQPTITQIILMRL